MDKQFLCLDSPTDFMVGKYISADELKEFINIPCKIKAGVFILCMEGQIRSTKEHNVSFYAEKLGLTFSYFSTSIKKAIGETPQEILTQTIIIDAKTQLKGTNQEIKNIAMDLGFNNLSFFNKFFRRNVGMTPQEYRGKSYTYSCYQKTSD